MRKYRQTVRNRINNYNSGSTLITVIVAIAFVTILTSIILGTTLVNMSMKGIDRRVKDDFYYAEKGLNDIYTGVGQKAAEFAGKQYDKAFNNIGKAGGYDTSEAAGDAFRKAFLQECYSEYHDGDVSSDTNRKNKLDAYVVHTVMSSRIESIHVVAAGDAKYRLKDGTDTDTFDEAKTVSVVLPNVSVCAKDKNDYQSIITTDIVIECPTVDFLGTNAEITDYAIIGCQGVYFTSTDLSNNSIEVIGNLYGGLHAISNTYDTNMGITSDQTYGGINVYGSNVNIRGNYIVSKGDINVGGNKPVLKIGTSDMSAGIPAVWFDTMRTVKDATDPKVDINANMYALNDLELNADVSDVLLKGDYYGYNDKTLLLDTEHSLSYSGRDDADSSSIIINGNKCSLDMSGVHSLVLMGKAYIDFTSKGTVPTGSPKIAESAESLALQTNQQLYLIPPDFLEGPNPATEENKNFKLNKTREDMEKWFGYKYVKQVDTVDTNKTALVDKGEISQTYIVKLPDGLGGTETVYYAYLKFNDKLWQKDGSHYKPAVTDTGAEVTKIGAFGSVSSKTAFFDEIMSATSDTDSELQPSAFRLRNKIIESIKNPTHFNLQKCIVNNTSSKVIYGRNAIVSYDTAGGVYAVRDNTAGMERFAGYPDNLFKRYQLLCVFLDGKEDLKLSDSITFNTKETTKIGTDWTKSKVASPMNNFILVNNITNGSSGKNITGDAAKIDSTGKYGLCIVKGGTSASYTVSASSHIKGTILVDGDVVIESGAEVDGLIMATGTIVIKGGSAEHPTRVKANKGLIQSRVEKEISLVEEGSVFKDNYLISYLTSDGTNRLYNVSVGSKKVENRIKPDYDSFMHYENWQKGSR